MQRGTDLLAEHGLCRGLMGKLVERGGDLLLLRLLLGGKWLTKWLTKRLANARLQAMVDLALSELAEAWIADGIAGDSLGYPIATHHSGRAEAGGRQCLSEIRSIISVRQ